MDSKSCSHGKERVHQKVVVMRKTIYELSKRLYEIMYSPSE